MMRIAIVTGALDEATLSKIAAFSGMNLVGARAEFTCWEWNNPNPTDLAMVEGLSVYKGTIPLS